MRFISRFRRSRGTGLTGPAAPTEATAAKPQTKGDQAAARRYWETEVAADEEKRGPREGRA